MEVETGPALTGRAGVSARSSEAFPESWASASAPDSPDSGVEAVNLRTASPRAFPTLSRMSRDIFPLCPWAPLFTGARRSTRKAATANRIFSRDGFMFPSLLQYRYWDLIRTLDKVPSTRISVQVAEPWRRKPTSGQVFRSAEKARRKGDREDDARSGDRFFRLPPLMLG